MFKIAILGPESSGKTQLAQGLARYYNAPWVAEFAREYVESLNEPYTFQDVCNIAKKQIDYEDQYNKNSTSNFVFFDTDLIITKVWFEYCYNEVPGFVTDKLQTCYFDFYLLCEPDLPWIPDPVREHGNDREYFFNWYKKEIEMLKTPYAIIRGFDSIRFNTAVQAIEYFFDGV